MRRCHYPGIPARNKHYRCPPLVPRRPGQTGSVCVVLVSVGRGVGGGGLKRGLCCHSAKQLMWAGGKGCVQV